MNNSANIIRLLGVDHQGSVLNYSANPLPEFCEYTAYGFNDGCADKTLLNYIAQHRNPLYALYLLGNGHRGYYCPLMRFISPDRLSPFGVGGINAYAYCSGDPINYRDSSGRAPLLFSFLRKTIKFDDTYQVLYPGNDTSAPTVFHKEVFQSGHAGFVTHGNASKGAVLMNQRGQTSSAKTVARDEIAPRLRGMPAYRDDPHKPLYLIACEAGSSGAAQAVADTLGRPVFAYKTKIHAPDQDFINIHPSDHRSLGVFESSTNPLQRKHAVADTYVPKNTSRIRRT
ncbi:RHS repeat-associated core domain-containing protein [Pantoea sp. Ap-967]|uniref:RHS repeat-associated core domain-containing protein n=1 Tax=Pantoea sp. Ap-967 TaxID=2608362 RepID=UPI00141E0531|nr:RHS repeat-associated core domain-containing protein [Pantoea sp. Ap-967]NIE77253.1 RHS repeat-associated core domain-containing protein [Pantoea sp. Ap-967]